MLPLLMYFILTRIKSVYFPLVFATLLLLSLGHPFTFVMDPELLASYSSLNSMTKHADEAYLDQIFFYLVSIFSSLFVVFVSAIRTRTKVLHI